MESLGILLIIAVIVFALKRNGKKRKSSKPYVEDAQSTIWRLNAQIAAMRRIAIDPIVAHSIVEKSKEALRRYEAILDKVIKALVLYDAGKGRISADHTILVLRLALMDLSKDIFELDAKQKAEAEEIVRNHVREFRARGWKTN